MASPGRPGVFLDRDGTIIVDRNYLGDPAGVELIPGAAAAILRLNQAGIPVLLITNQSGIGRGYFSEEDFLAVQQRMGALLAAEGASLDGVYYCPHSPDRSPPCECRKPAGGLFLRAAQEHEIDLSRSYFIGDSLRDVDPAVDLGGQGILVGNCGQEAPQVPAVIWQAEDLSEAVDRVLAALTGD